MAINCLCTDVLSITSKLEAVMEASGTTEKTTTQISDDIKANMEKILRHLSHEKDLLSQQLNPFIITSCANSYLQLQLIYQSDAKNTY